MSTQHQHLGRVVGLSLANPLFWGALVVYAGRGCCGTWVADGFVSQLLQPVTSSQRNSHLVDSMDVPIDDKVGALHRLNPALRETVCAGRPDLYTSNIGNKRGVPATCPKLCSTACCGMLKDEENFLRYHHFSQCTPKDCASEDCLFSTTLFPRTAAPAPAPARSGAALPITVNVPAPAPAPAIERVLLRQYQRATYLKGQKQAAGQSAGQSAGARGG
jgi:hypothetical protein